MRFKAPSMLPSPEQCRAKKSKAPRAAKLRLHPGAWTNARCPLTAVPERWTGSEYIPSLPWILCRDLSFPCAGRSGDPGPSDSWAFEVKHAHEQIAASGTVTSGFARRFVVEGKDGKHLADIGADAVDLVGLHEGDEVTFKDRRKLSEIKVTEIAKGRGESMRLERKHKHERKNGHDRRRACRDPRAAVAAVKLEGFEVLGEPREKPKHFEILGRSTNGKFIEFHVEPDGAIGKRKPADTREPKWASAIAQK
ncbi:hypothetical protein [Rhodoblastus sp.]|uniref:hypothetical protein n=1 Tax=Rhodoblastus sp. TaxID=1962975 RepID=UPI003FD7CD06